MGTVRSKFSMHDKFICNHDYCWKVLNIPQNRWGWILEITQQKLLFLQESPSRHHSMYLPYVTSFFPLSRENIRNISMVKCQRRHVWWHRLVWRIWSNMFPQHLLVIVCRLIFRCSEPVFLFFDCWNKVKNKCFRGSNMIPTPSFWSCFLFLFAWTI